ncbi:histidine phosphatase family protein [Xylophilus ampelinus]|uniref:Alpha-ribazole phosphatase n=1 Tax=Xylophilus ampelinus TaxID=54067 RepID=A0A318SFG1_9BURK|nr:histidine phosphatase family protein [Xylophilus ampelinus]MCS4511028.1 histidine phosphatase family protein [Xylophilus ampelinus]PYE75978.1 alpha-ribazole phosphatase [Xylophilus ampelinus]
MTRLWLVRHAVPLLAPGICYGRTDVPADPAATRRAAEALAAALPAGCRVVRSPLQRCTALADALHRLRPDLPSTPDPRLAEMDFGDWEGHAWDALGAERLDAWTADFAHHAPGGGESVQGFLARVAEAFDELGPSGEADVAWIAHAGVGRAARLLTAGVRQVARAGDWPKEGLAFGGWAVVELPAPAAGKASITPG